MEKITVIVFTRSLERFMYFNLFQVMLGKENVISQRHARYESTFETVDFHFSLRDLSESSRGRKAHFVLNLVQDKELDDLVAKPIAFLARSLDSNSRWRKMISEEVLEPAKPVQSKNVEDAKRLIRDVCDADTDKSRVPILEKVTIQQMMRIYNYTGGNLS